MKNYVPPQKKNLNSTQLDVKLSLKWGWIVNEEILLIYGNWSFYDDCTWLSLLSIKSQISI